MSQQDVWEAFREAVIETGTALDPVVACPECEVGKHYNYDRTALDEQNDLITDCDCYLWSHKPPWQDPMLWPRGAM